MKVDAFFFASPQIANDIIDEVKSWLADSHRGEPAIIQLAKITTLDGITDAVYGMPDLHSGYGFPIGCVAAVDISGQSAMITPNGIGYDINCGMRILSTGIHVSQLSTCKETIINAILKRIPTGVGGQRKNFVTKCQVDYIMQQGVHWAVENGYGIPSDIEYCEYGGCFQYADIHNVSNRAAAYGLTRLGTLGSGNHFIEIQVVDQIFSHSAARAMKLVEGEVVVMIHVGGSGLGYQVAKDYINVEGTCPYRSEQGHKYVSAMAAASNFAFANRQIITHFIREAFVEVFGSQQIELIWDTAHNVMTLEGDRVVHRKGAARALGPSSPELPPRYHGVGQPVPIGGGMGNASYVLAGTDENAAFATVCHGSGRKESRTHAQQRVSSEELMAKLRRAGVCVSCAGTTTLVDEAGDSFKDIEEVVRICEVNNLAQKVARLRPVCVVKG